MLLRSAIPARGLRALATSASSFPSWTTTLNKSLRETDPEVFDIIEHEKRRQLESIDLIPSENFTSQSVLEALGSVMQNKYSEGYPNARYYGGNEFIDQSELLCQKRALEAFKLNPAEWGVNVQALSGSPANLHAYFAVLKPGDRIMGLDLPHGGHLSHGYQTDKKKISAVSAYFQTMPYRLNEQTGLIDYDALERSAALFRPKLIIAGFSAYSRNYDYARMRRIANSVGAYLLSDMAHISGLVAADAAASPFPHSDIVTTTTHKLLRGPRGAMIFYRKGVRSTDAKGNQTMYDIENHVNASVFPGHQGGPHNHTITALAVALKQVNTPAFKEYADLVVENSKAFADSFLRNGYKLVSGGTENHLFLVDLTPLKVDGARVERVLELVNIAANKNTVPTDTSALVPGGLRVGTPAMTTRGLRPADFEKVAGFVHEAIQQTSALHKSLPGNKLKDFKEALKDGQHIPAIKDLRERVSAFATSFPAIGFNIQDMKYRP